MLVSQNYLKFYIDKIDYVNPIKTSPNRIYLSKDDKQAQHINDIEDFVNFFSRKIIIMTKFFLILLKF